MNKLWILTSTHTLTLAPIIMRGHCHKCEVEKDIWLISDTPWEYRKLCRSCSLDSVRKLETGDYPVKNKEQIVKELREILLSNPSPKESKYLNCYE